MTERGKALLCISAPFELGVKMQPATPCRAYRLSGIAPPNQLLVVVSEVIHNESSYAAPCAYPQSIADLSYRDSLREQIADFVHVLWSRDPAGPCRLCFGPFTERGHFARCSHARACVAAPLRKTEVQGNGMRMGE